MPYGPVYWHPSASEISEKDLDLVCLNCGQRLGRHTKPPEDHPQGNPLFCPAESAPGEGSFATIER